MARFIPWMAAGSLLLALSSCGRPTGSASNSKPTDPESPSTVEGTAEVRRTDRSLEIVSKTYSIDRIYRSMTGPWSQEKISLMEHDAPELCWITGCQVAMVGADGEQPMDSQLMCHANLDFDPESHKQKFGFQKNHEKRLFTLSQGQLHVQFPDGFGMPFFSNEPLALATQVLNLNVQGDPFQVRHRVRIDFVRSRNATAPYKPLYQTSVFGMKSLEGRELVYDGPDDSPHGPCTSCCLPGIKASDSDENEDRQGRKFPGHWVVKPGREVNRTRATTLMDLHFDTTVHHIAVHVHPFAESLELRDLTTDETVFKAMAENLDDRIGLEHVDQFSSAEGWPVYQDHEYELISVYNNTTHEDQDSMAVMYMYLLDKEFGQTTIEQASVPDLESGVENVVVTDRQPSSDARPGG